MYHELLWPSQTIDFVLYYQQLTTLKQAIEKNRPELVNKKRIVFHHDNTRPHTSLMDDLAKIELDWEILMHPPYSPDLAPGNHSLRSLQISLSDVILVLKEACENLLSQLFARKPQKFYSNVIMVLPEKWPKVIEQNSISLV